MLTDRILPDEHFEFPAQTRLTTKNKEGIPTRRL
jgi:hypothetical protein